MILWWKVSSAPVASLLKEQGSNAPALRASLRVTEKYTSITHILNAVAHLQLEVCKSSQDLFKHLRNKNHHIYLQNHIKSISTWRLSNHQRTNNFLNIRYVVVTTRADPGGVFGAIAPHKTYKSNFIHHNFAKFTKQHLRYKAILTSIVMSQQCCEVYFICLTIVNP